MRKKRRSYSSEKPSRATASTQRSDETTFVMDLAPSMVGWMIGRHGTNIKSIRRETNCNIWVDQDVPGDQPRKIFIMGTKENVVAAVRKVDEIQSTAPPVCEIADGTNPTSICVDCPADLVGLLIGRGGSTIKSIQRESGALISLNQFVKERLPRKIVVSGGSENVEKAASMIENLFASARSDCHELRTVATQSALHSAKGDSSFADAEWGSDFSLNEISMNVAFAALWPDESPYSDANIP